MLIKRLIDKIFHRISPVKYWRSKGCIIGQGAEIYHSATFGSEPYLITIGNHVRINEGVKLITHDGGVWVLRVLHKEYEDIDVFGRISIGNNVHIGTNSIIMPNISIGDNVVIGCGSIVTKNVPDNCIVAGVPAKVIEDVSLYESKNRCRFLHTKTLSQKEKKIYLLNKRKL